MIATTKEKTTSEQKNCLISLGFDFESNNNHDSFNLKDTKNTLASIRVQEKNNFELYIYDEKRGVLFDDILFNLTEIKKEFKKHLTF